LAEVFPTLKLSCHLLLVQIPSGVKIIYTSNYWAGCKIAHTCLLPCACRRRPEKYPWTGLSCPCSALGGCAWGSAGPAGFFVETCGGGLLCGDLLGGVRLEGLRRGGGLLCGDLRGLLRGLLCGDRRGGVRLCGLSAGGLRLCGGLVRCGPPPCWGPAQLKCWLYLL
jgi:hypothetical protein